MHFPNRELENKHGVFYLRQTLQNNAAVFSNGCYTGLSTEMRKNFSVSVCNILQHFKV